MIDPVISHILCLKYDHNNHFIDHFEHLSWLVSGDELSHSRSDEMKARIHLLTNVQPAGQSFRLWRR
jgi:hypothetical protein